MDEFGQKITKNIFTRNTWTRDGDRIMKLKLRHFVSEDKKVLTNQSMNLKTNCNFTFNEWMTVKSIIKNCLKDLGENLDLSSTDSIQRFMMNSELRSKDFRTFFRPDRPQIKNLLTTKNRYSWANVTPVETAREVLFHKVWQTNFLPIDLRHFSLKFVNNYYKLNIHLHNTDPTISSDCSFCTTNYVALGAEREKIDHFFGKCHISQNFAKTYFSSFLQNTHATFSIDWLLVGAPTNLAADLIFLINIEIMFLNFFMYNCRFKRKKPLINDFLQYMSWNRKVLMRNNIYHKKFLRLQIPFDNG